MNSTPNLTSLFLFEVLTVVVLGSIFLSLAIYAVRETRSTERSRIAARENPTDEVARSLPESEFYYLSTGELRSAIDMKVRLYSLEDYGRELGRAGEDFRSSSGGGFVAALKAYGYHVDRWYEMPCEQAGSCLGLKAEEFEVDEDRGALLLRKLPDGLPAKAGEKIDQRISRGTTHDLGKNVR